MLLSSDPAFIPMPSPPLNGCNGGVRERAPSWADKEPQAAMPVQSILGLDEGQRLLQSAGWIQFLLCENL